MKITKTIICITSSILLCILQHSRSVVASHPTPSPWPEQFHAKLYSNLSMSTRKYLQVTDMWYDWPKGRNVYMMQHQLGDLLHEIEWNNGTSFYYTLPGGGGGGSCRVVDFGVGITRPDFLDGADYVGTRVADGGFLCNVWEKLGFIWYYEDVSTKRPVKWDFSDGITTHVITFKVGAVLEDSLIQAPAFCFSQDHRDA